MSGLIYSLMSVGSAEFLSVPLEACRLLCMPFFSVGCCLLPNARLLGWMPVSSISGLSASLDACLLAGNLSAPLEACLLLCMPFLSAICCLLHWMPVYSSGVLCLCLSFLQDVVCSAGCLSVPLEACLLRWKPVRSARCLSAPLDVCLLR